MKTFNVHTSWLLLSLVIGLAYTFATEIYSEEKWFLPVTYGMYVTLLGVCISLLLEIQAKMRKTDDDLQSLADRAQELIDMHRLNSAVSNTRYELQKRKPYVALAGVRTLRKYAKSFYVTSDGYAVEGEQGALTSYEEFWRLLVDKQKKLGFSDAKRLIARITHSNDISLWSLRDRNNAHTLRQLQENFIKAGGIIVRIFIHAAEEPTEEYRQVMDWMEEIGVDARYVSSNHPNIAIDFRYDFLLVRNDVENEHYVAKWYTGSHGMLLDKCEISDVIDDDVLARWNALVHASIAKYQELDVIPLSRQFGEKSTSRRFPRVHSLKRAVGNWARDRGWIEPGHPGRRRYHAQEKKVAALLPPPPPGGSSSEFPGVTP